MLSTRTGHGASAVVSAAFSGRGTLMPVIVGRDGDGPARGRTRADMGFRGLSPTMEGMTTSTTSTPDTEARQDAKRVLLAAPRGYCAGVDRAVVAVERALELYGPPVYVRKQIVHNKHVVSTLEKRGAIFVEETDQVPEGATVVFSAHGVAPVVHDEAR